MESFARNKGHVLVLLITIFENIENIILVFSKNCFYSLNLVFICFLEQNKI